MVLPATAGIVDMARQPRPRKTRARPRRAPRGPRAPERPRQRATARTSTAHLHPLGTAPRPRTFSLGSFCHSQPSLVVTPMVAAVS